MSNRPVRTLIICHASTLERAISRVRSDEGARATDIVDALLLSRTVNNVAPLDGCREVLTLTGAGSAQTLVRATLALATKLRRRRYTRTVIAWPQLASSQIRGPLQLLPFLLVSCVVVAQNDAAEFDAPISAAAAFIDMVRWMFLQSIAGPLSLAIALGVRFLIRFPRVSGPVATFPVERQSSTSGPTSILRLSRWSQEAQQRTRSA